MIKKGIPGQKYQNPGGIYLITSVTTGEIYVGKASNLNNRYCQHAYDLRNNKHKNSRLQELYNTYGRKELVMTVLERVIDQELPLLESFEVKWIKKLNPSINVVNTRLCKPDVDSLRKRIDSGESTEEDICKQYDLTLKYLKEILRGGRWIDSADIS